MREPILELFRKHGQLKRTVKHLEERISSMADEVQELQQALEGLQADVNTKLGEFDTEIKKLEQEHNVPATTLQPLKDLVASIDAVIKGVTPTPGPTPPAPAPSPTPPEPAAGPQQSLYLFTAGNEGGTPDPTVWPTAPFVTDEPTPRQLYYNAQDTPGQTPATTTGAGQPGWELYTGPVKASGA